MDDSRLSATPLRTMSLEEAVAEQFRLVETIGRHFPQNHLLTQGDLGVAEPLGRPAATAAVEECLADFFRAQDAVLLTGAGTGALRAAFFAAVPAGGTVVRHDAPVYETTAVTLRAMGVTEVPVDFHALPSTGISADAALAGHARQALRDHYDLAEVITGLRRLIGDAPIIVDENYAVLKVARLGAELGADLSAFSAFKLFGPPGVGVVVGARDLVEVIRRQNRSGGCQVQGADAMDVLRGMVHVPVQAALQAEAARQVADRLNGGEVPGIASAVMTNNAETIVLARLRRPVAAEFIAAAGAAGAAGHPVGAESRFELVPLVYRVSKALLAQDRDHGRWLVRINPNRGGADHCLAILRAADQAVTR
jgi:hypothetical protein